MQQECSQRRDGRTGRRVCDCFWANARPSGPRGQREGLSEWYAAGADMPIIVLPPGGDLDELDHALEALSPLGPAGQGTDHHDRQEP